MESRNQTMPLRADLFNKFAIINDAEQKNLEDGVRFSFMAANHQTNRNKNRYGDILPFDQNRIHTPAVPYINASAIEALDKRRYIATQGPLPHTVWDFWSTVIWSKCSVIVMLCNTTEKGREKCAVYWPQSPDQPLLVTSGDNNNNNNNNDNSVTIIGGNGSPKYSVCLKRLSQLAGTTGYQRELEIYAVDETCGSSSAEQKTLVHQCIQLHYTGWPDHGVPRNTDDFLNFIRHWRQLQGQQQQQPVLVHSLASAGREHSSLSTL